MQFFLDTANIDAIKKYHAWGVVNGVTTNPSLIAKEGAVLEKRIKEIAKIIKGPISVEVLATDPEGMINEARTYTTWGSNIVIKLPCSENGLKACYVLSDEGLNVNMTLVFSTAQFLLAAKAGAKLISPFIGRLDDVGEDGMAMIRELKEIYEHYDLKAKIVVASVRHPRHVIEAAMLGAHIATIPPDVMDKMIKHPLTDNGIEKFLKDWEKSRGN
jgi:transaldolase